MLRSFLVLLQPVSRFYPRPLRVFLPVVLLGLILAACGATANNSATSSSYKYGSANGGQSGANTPGASGSGGSPTLPNGTPVNSYLIRTLTVGLQVNQPLDAEAQISQDVFSMDSQAQAAGEQISQQDDGSYSVVLTFAISSPKYEAVKTYLNGFAAAYPTFKAKLIGENETVQDVTNQYVDLQSRLKNLQTEQARLLQLLSQAQNLADTLTIQDKLTDVEGQIEQIEGQLNQLDSQTSYSMVTVNLSATAVTSTPPPAPQQPWNPGGVLGAAFNVLLGVLQVVADVLIWLLVFTPVWLAVLGGFYVWRRIKQRRINAGVRASVRTAGSTVP